MGTRERIISGAHHLGLDVQVYGDGPKDRRPPRSPAPGIPPIYADVKGRPEDIKAAYDAGFELECEARFAESENVRPMPARSFAQIINGLELTQPEALGFAGDCDYQSAFDTAVRRIEAQQNRPWRRGEETVGEWLFYCNLITEDEIDVVDDGE